MPISPSRRRFLGYLAASPIAAQETRSTLASPQDALSVFDFEEAARKIIPPAHFGYMATGVDSDMTLKANRAAFDRYYLRPRRLVDVSKVDTSVELLGSRWETPIIMAPCAAQKAFHPLGEVATARASATRKTLMILSTAATTSVETAAKEATRPVWYQLYPTAKWEVTARLIERAEAAGCPVLAVTVDLPAGRNTETADRSRALDKRVCASCHGERGPGGLHDTFFRRKPMFDGLDMKGMNLYAPALTWETIGRMRQMTKMKIAIKGIVTAEDAALAVEHGMDAIVVSNHGGRAEESGRGSVDCLPQVVEAVRGRMPVLVDGGFRRGTDIFKALAMGARAVLVGRPYLWGLGAFGQPGVEAVLDMLRRELELVMKQCGARSMAEINSRHIGTV